MSSVVHNLRSASAAHWSKFGFLPDLKMIDGDQGGGGLSDSSLVISYLHADVQYLKCFRNARIVMISYFFRCSIR